jgi:hypothetical protein
MVQFESTNVTLERLLQVRLNWNSFYITYAVDYILQREICRLKHERAAEVF